MSKKFIFYSDSGLEIKDLDNGDSMVEGYITTGDRDLVGDIVSKECMADMLLQLSSGNIKIDMEHEAFRGDTKLEKQINKTINPIARIVSAEMDEKGIKIKGLMNSHNRRIQEAKGSIKDKFLTAFSIAYLPIKTAQIADRMGVESRLLDRIRLLNVALTGNPVNQAAQITDVMMKSLEATKEREDDEVKQMAEIKDKIDEDKIEAKSIESIAADLKSLTETVAEFKKTIEEIKEKDTTDETDDSTDETKAGYIGGNTQPTGGKKKKKAAHKEGDDEDEDEDEKKDEEKKSELAEIKKEVADLKAILNKPEYKATVEEMREALSKVSTSVKPKGPLDLIK